MINELNIALLAAVFSLFAIWLGNKYGFFQLKANQNELWKKKIHFLEIVFLVIAFFLLLTLSFLLIKFYLDPFSIYYTLEFLMFLQTGTWLLVLGLNSFRTPAKTKEIWGFDQLTFKQALYKGLIFSCVAWLISCPIQICLVNFAQGILQLFDLPWDQRQGIVDILKKEFYDPGERALFIFVITLLVPIAEEWFFRGYLYTWLRQKFKIPATLMISSLIFTLAHLESRLGWSFLYLSLALFTLSCFLGFIYEKTGTLLTPIFMHIIVNSLTVITLLYFDSAI